MAHSGGHSKGHLGGTVLKLILAGLSGAGGDGSSAASSAGAEGDVGGAIGDGDVVGNSITGAGGMSGGNSRMSGGRPVMSKPPSMPLDTPVSTNGSLTPPIQPPSLTKPGFWERYLDPQSISTYYQGQGQLANTALQGQMQQQLSAQQAQQELDRQAAASALDTNKGFADKTTTLLNSMGIPISSKEDLVNATAQLYHPSVINALASKGVESTTTATKQSIADTQLDTANSDAGRQTVKTGFEAEQLKPFADVLAKAPKTSIGENIDTDFPGLGSIHQHGALPAGQTTSAKKVGTNGQVFENNITTTSAPYSKPSGGFTQPIQLPSMEDFQNSQQGNPNQGNFNVPVPQGFNSQPGIGGGNTNILAKPPTIFDPNLMTPENQIQVQQMIQRLQQSQGYQGPRDANGYPIARPPSPFWDSINFGN